MGRQLNKGDVVKCLVNDYSEYDKGQEAFVLDATDQHIKLANRQSPIGYCWYLAKNWQFTRLSHPTKSITEPKEKPAMAAYEKTKYFAIQVKEGNGIFLTLDPDHQTCLRDTKSQVFTDVKEHIQQGEQWLVLQTIALIEPTEPRPPIKVTEYK